MKLTVCTIARNEETALPKMLESVKDVADEIIICDTGSTDNTIEVAKRYTDKVYVHPKADEWRENPGKFSFAEARNYALEQCTGDWILSMDCDELLDLESAGHLRSMLERVPQGVEMVLPTMVMCHDDGSEYQRFPAERIFKRNGCRWHGDMHNWLDIPPDEHRVNAPGLKLVHNRAAKSEPSREERAGQRLEMAEHHLKPRIDANPGDRRSIFYLAGTLFDCQKFAEAAEWFEHYMQASDQYPDAEWVEERYHAAYLLAQAYEHLGQREKARRAMSAGLCHNWRRSEGMMLLGDLALASGDHHQAIKWYQFASLLPMPLDPMFIEVDAYTWRPHLGLWTAYQAVGENQKAAEHGRKAIELGAPNTGAILKFEKQHTFYEDKKIAVLVDRGQMSFIEPVIEHWAASGREVKVTREASELAELVESSDVVFCEWAGELAVELTKLPKTARIVMRIHGYEAYASFLDEINWLKVDDVIFVADFLRDMICERVPLIAETCNCYVVPGGVETHKFSIGDGKTGKRMAMLGFVNARKNIPLALQVLAASPDFELHIAGQWQDVELYHYVLHAAGEMGVKDRLFIYGAVEDANAFFADKDFILSTGIRETFHYALAEGMAAGLRPIVHCWDSASDFYEDAWIFRTVDEAVAMLGGPREPEKYRAYAVEHLDVTRNLRRIDRILARPAVAVAGEPKYPYAAEYHLLRSMESLGCRTDAPDPKAVFIWGPNPKTEEWRGKTKIVRIAEALAQPEVEERDRAIARDVDLAIAQSPEWCERLWHWGAREVQHIPILGAVPPFYPIVGTEKKWDVGFFGHQTEHRTPKIEALGQHFDVGFLEGCYDHVQVNLFFNQCRVVVNLHAWPEPIIEWRIAEAMTAGACVVSERLPEGHPFPADCLVETDDVAGAVRELLADGRRREALAKRGHSWIWRHMRLEHQVEKLLESVGL